MSLAASRVRWTKSLLGDSLGEHHYLIPFLQLREVFLKLGNLFLERVGLIVLLFRIRYFSSPALFSGAVYRWL